jgi:hypothetical protein
MAQAILKLCDEMEATGAAIAALSRRTDSEAFRELIQTRRTLAEQLPRLINVCTAALQALPPETQALMLAQLRALGSAFRSELAQLQADWPSVSIRANPDGYQRQKLKLANAEAAFFSWLIESCLPIIDRHTQSR